MAKRMNKGSLESWKTAMHKARCGDCHWFEARPDENGSMRIFGECYAYPPTVVMTPAPVGEDRGPDIRNERPYVKVDERCRLFLEKPPSPPKEYDFSNPDGR